MTSSGPFSSLSVRQAVRGMSMALVLGLALTAVEMTWSVSRERLKAEHLANEIMDLLEGAASTSVWTFDHELGHRVARDALTLQAVHALELRLPNGEVMAVSTRGSATPSLLGALVFGDLAVVERTLYRPQFAGVAIVDESLREATGVMRIQLDAAVISADLLAFLGNSLVSGLIRNLLLGLALTAAFNRFLTRPLVQLGREIERIDPARPEDSALTVPDGHGADELGGIAVRVNEVLKRLTAVQGDLRRLSTRDPLTRLPNRALFDEGLATAIIRARRNGQGVAVMAVEMRAEALARGGDDAVRYVAARLRDCVRGADLVARLGPGEFAAVLADADAPGAMRVADRVLSGLAHGLPVGDARIDITPAIGIALYPTEASDAEALTARARAAAARAGAGDAQVQFVTEGLNHAAQAYLARADALLSALELDRVQLKYMPSVEVATGAVCGVTVIPEWRHDGTATEGFALVQFAREVGLDASLGDKVLRRALGAAAGRNAGLPLTLRCVQRQLTDPGFVDLVARLRRESGIPPGGLALLVAQADCAAYDSLPALRALSAQDVPLWLDVRSPETLSLGTLTGGMFAGIEIVAPAGEPPPALAAAMRLAADAGLQLSARAVAGPAQRSAMARAGCTRLRGPGVAAAVPLDRLEATLAGLATADLSGAAQ